MVHYGYTALKLARNLNVGVGNAPVIFSFLLSPNRIYLGMIEAINVYFVGSFAGCCYFVHDNCFAAEEPILYCHKIEIKFCH